MQNNCIYSLIQINDPMYQLVGMVVSTESKSQMWVLKHDGVEEEP